jgi:hypothetical protein
MSEEIDEQTDNQKTEALKDKDIEDDSSYISKQEKDINFGDYIEAFVFDDKLEKEKTMKMEQNFVDSNLEKKTWIPSSSTSLDKEDTSYDEEKAFVAEPFT